MAEFARSMERTLAQALREFPVVAIVGLRQSGKTTLARRSKGRHYVTLDDLGALGAAQRDPRGFLQDLPRPVTIDEVQRVPNLLLAVKETVDRKRRNGEFLLTGSSRVELRKGVQDSLAGRLALLRMRPATWSEAAGRPAWNPVDRIFSCRTARDLAVAFPSGPALNAARVLAGGLPPPVLKRSAAARVRWFAQYRSAYVERDVPPLMRVEEVSTFVRFLQLAAVRTSQTANHASLGRDTGISTDSSLRWLGILEATFLVDQAPPYWRNLGKRLVKTPKLHLGDAGVAASLAGIRDWPEALRQGMAGPLLETLVFQHAQAFAEVSRAKTDLFHYRTHAGQEVDLVLSRGSRVVPVEVKLSRTASGNDGRGLEAFLGDFPKQAAFGILLYGGTEVVPMGRSLVAVPLSVFLEGV